jgi:TRAP transporter TAXI family solute receptor
MKVVLTLLMFLFCQPALALTIATGTPEGTYYQIAQDIKQIAEKEGIPVEIIQTNGSFDNINLLGLEKVDLAILQLDVLKVTSDAMQAKAGFNVLKEIKVILNLYFEEIHVITKNDGIRSLSQLEGKKVAVGPDRSGSALTAEVLLTAYDLRVEKFFDAPNDALQKLERGELDALIFVGGAPVPAFEKLDPSFRFVRLPSNPILEQLYQRKKIDKGVYPWAGEVETFAVPSAIMTRDRRDSEYVTLIQRLLLTILSNKEKLDAIGHPKWKTAQFRFMIPSVAYPPSNDVILIYNILDAYGYGIIKK